MLLKSPSYYWSWFCISDFNLVLLTQGQPWSQFWSCLLSKPILLTTIPRTPEVFHRLPESVRHCLLERTAGIAENDRKRPERPQADKELPHETEGEVAIRERRDQQR